MSEPNWDGYFERLNKRPNICVDVDGTLIFWPGKHPGRIPRRGEPGHGEPPRKNESLIERLLNWREESGGTIAVWSWGGIDHARMADEFCGLDADACLGKPNTYIDDDVKSPWRGQAIQVKSND